LDLGLIKKLAKDKSLLDYAMAFGSTFLITHEKAARPLTGMQNVTIHSSETGHWRKRKPPENIRGK
jgi:hypothetical protein